MDEKPSSHASGSNEREIDDSDPYIGKTFGGRYEILSKIGEGSQARVYLARHVLIDRPVAVKFLLPVLASDKGLVARFLNEGRAAGTLGHPNIVESLDMGYAPDGVPYLVLELLQGRTLAREIAAIGAFSAGRAAYIASQIASALSATHARGIVHRDLKPENVLLVERGGRPDHAKVLDFGISKFATGGSRVTTIKGQPLGTPGFMAPEQVEDPQGIDARADVYGLGATLYTMLSGEAPFVEVGFPKVLRLIVEEEPRKLSEARPDLPRELVAIVECAMSKAPAARFQTMADFEDALSPFAEEPSRVRGGLPAVARPPVVVPRPTPVSPKVASMATSSSDQPKTLASNARQRRNIVLGGVLLVVALALLTWRASTHDERLHASAASAAQTKREEPPRAAPAVVPASAETLVAPPATTTPSATAARTPLAASGRRREKSTFPPAVKSQRGPSPVAAVPPASAEVSSATTSCDPPFYFEGRKKIFKPGCI